MAEDSRCFAYCTLAVHVAPRRVCQEEKREEEKYIVGGNWEGRRKVRMVVIATPRVHARAVTL
jgi:hypothetical protein